LKYLRFPRPSPALGLALSAVFAVALWPAGPARVGAQQQGAPPPPPPVPGAASPLPSSEPAALPSEQPIPSAAPSPEESPSPAPRRGRHRAPAPESSTNPEPSPTPTSPAFATLDGTWEVQLQYMDHTDYSYLTIAQKDQTIAGTWRLPKSVSYPFEGTYDGRLIRMFVKEPSGTVTLSGYVEGASDMVGIVDAGNGVTPNVAFTAEHRPSSKGSLFKKGPS